MLSVLPEEVCLHVLGYLTASELGGVCELVNSEWRRIALTDCLWRHLFRLAYPGAAAELAHADAAGDGEEGAAKRPRRSYRELYREYAEREQREIEEQEHRKHATEEPVFRLNDLDSSPEAVATFYEGQRDPSTKAHDLLAQYNESTATGDIESAFELSKMAIYFFERLIEETKQGTQEAVIITYLRWHLGLIAAYTNKGLSLRHLGFLSLAINSYTKAIQLHDQLVADHVEIASAFIITAAHYHRVTATKNCGMAYMLLDQPELALPMIDRATKWVQDMWDSGELAGDNEQAHYYNLLASFTNRFKAQAALADWEKAAADFHHVYAIEANYREEAKAIDWAARPRRERVLAEVASQVWRGLRLQVLTMAVEQPEDFGRLVAALDHLSPQAAASARQIGATDQS